MSSKTNAKLHFDKFLFFPILYTSLVTMTEHELVYKYKVPSELGTNKADDNSPSI
jgi:hypothetical protein